MLPPRPDISEDERDSALVVSRIPELRISSRMRLQRRSEPRA